ncbi:MAG: carbohydrate ABC transporter permease [Clostridiales bacterium]|nr:carbohydrate ABC transporter permease [Clostridiales bacterium]
MSNVASKKVVDNTSGSGVYNASEKRYQVLWSIFFIIVSIIAIVPILRVISISLSSKDAILKGQVFVWPVGINTDAYSKALKTGNFIGTMGYSVVLMISAAAINMVMTILMAFPLARRNLRLGSVIMTFCVLTMYLNPGTIPTFLNVRDFGLINTVWALLIPGAMSVYNMIIMRTAFRAIDESLYEAARIEGCSEFRIMWQIAVPLTVPTIATLALFYAVSRWNGIEDQIYYINSSNLYTVQMTLKQMIESIAISAEEGSTTQMTPENVKAASITLSMLPMLIVYPFVQRFFTQGIMLGAVKG